MTTKKEFINSCKKYKPEVDLQILQFIADFVYHADNQSTYHLFSQGYCYHFALILKNTFNKGEICWVAPFAHFIWLYNDIPYDINGIYDGESKTFIPEKYLGHAINDFKRIPGIIHNAQQNGINKIIKKYLNDKEKQND